MPLMAGNRGPEVPDVVKRQVRALSDDKCAFCHRSLLEPVVGARSPVYIGEIAHIYPSSPGGERGGQRRPRDVNGPGNLMALCRVCHRLVDAPRVGGRIWTIDKLLRMKAEHEAWVALQSAPRPATEPEVLRGPLNVRPGGLIEADGLSFWLTARAGVSGRLDQFFAEQWSPDGDAVRSACYAYAETGGAGHAWLRRAAFRAGSADGERWRQELADTVTLLSGGLPDLPGLPRLLAFESGPEELAVVTALPSAATLGDRFGDGGTAEEAVRALLAGLPQLCAALGALQDAGRAHGALDAASVVVDRRGCLALRDLGRAAGSGDDGAWPVDPGAGGFLAGSGERDDVRALAALVYRAVTGAVPLAGPDGPPVPASMLNPAVPEAASRALAEALAGGIRDPRALARRMVPGGRGTRRPGQAGEAERRT
jgi:hypothetical protein